MTAPANTPRKVVLRKLQPKCAERTAMLSPDPDIEPSMGYRRALRLPEDGLAVTAVIGVDDWIARGRAIYVQQGAVDPPYAVIYTADVTDLAPHVQAAADALERYEASETLDDADYTHMAYSAALAKAKKCEAETQALETAA